MKYLASLCILVNSTLTFAQPLPLGQSLEAPISFCATQEEAERVVQAHKEKGFGVAARMVQESQTCDTAYVGFVMRRIASSIKVGSRTIYVVQIDVEMADDTWQTFYAMLATGGNGQEV